MDLYYWTFQITVIQLGNKPFPNFFSECEIQMRKPDLSVAVTVY